MSDVTKLALDYPITTPDGTVISELAIRRAKAKDIRKITGKTETEQAMSLLSILTGIVFEDLDELDIADFKRAADIVEKQQKGKSA
ncbi:phage tail protein [Bibersteinia trehalosi Y31]|uniref:Phage tail protein n=1 Tax=Bibersteinia trehalosi Y31 TaxID=1261658 RepID=A0A179CYP2_BIBTR|nr:phage tail assembly protein [Bibersteinia trehalosi]OAQ15026.1 phage tail protein [Bibersteinia trehalosi Y31]